MNISPFSPLPFSPSWPLSPRLMLMPPPPTMVDTMAIPTLTDMDMVLDTEDTMVDTTAIVMELTDMPTTTARGPLMPKPIPHTCTLVPMATLMPMVLILMDTTDSELLLPTMPVALATNMFPPLLPPMVSLNSTKDPLMPNPRLMLPPPTMVDTMVIPVTMVMDTDTDMVLDTAVTTAETDTVVSATTVKLYDVVKNQWRGHEPLSPCR